MSEVRPHRLFPVAEGVPAPVVTEIDVFDVSRGRRVWVGTYKADALDGFEKASEHLGSGVFELVGRNADTGHVTAEARYEFGTVEPQAGDVTGEAVAVTICLRLVDVIGDAFKATHARPSDAAGILHAFRTGADVARERDIALAKLQQAAAGAQGEVVQQLASFLMSLLKGDG